MDDQPNSKASQTPMPVVVLFANIPNVHDHRERFRARGRRRGIARLSSGVRMRNADSEYRSIRVVVVFIVTFRCQWMSFGQAAGS